MSCQVIRNVDTNEIEKVMAPNGKESILYKDINSYIASKEESLLAYAQIYTPSFKEWFGDWEGGKEPVTKSSYASKLKNYYNEGFEERPDHKSWYVKDHLDIVQNVVDDLHTKYGGDKNILDLMVYTHDLAKAMNNEKMSHRETIEPVLKEMGIADNVINTVISNVEMMDRVKKEDVTDLPIEVKILSTADALSHYTTGDRGFLNIFSNETSKANMSDIEASNKNKLAKDKRKILLPEFSLDDTKITYKDRTTSVAGSVTNYLNSLSKNKKEISSVSQVVDANGEPKLVFHWSPVHGIERFNLAGIGSHFGTLQAADEVNEAKTKTKFTLVDKEMGTEEEIETEGEPGAFYPAFLNLRNMAEIVDKGQHTEEKDGAEAKALLDKGHDGFQYINQFEDIGSTSYVATQENQIKSLYNKGTFSKNTGNIYANLTPETSVDFSLKVVSALTNLSQPQEDKRTRKYGEENQPERLTIRLNTKEKPFLEENIRKTLANKGVPKQQIQFVFDYMKKNGIKEISTEELAATIAAEYSYAIEINIAKQSFEGQGLLSGVSKSFTVGDYLYKIERRPKSSNNLFDFTTVYTKTERNTKIKQEITKTEYNNALPNTDYYSKLTVQGGTNYAENEIATPNIKPSIMGHAQFATKNGIGWFRSDDDFNSTSQTDKEIQAYLKKGSEDYKAGRITQQEFFDIRDLKNIGFKTRRILELQSDLFQKGRGNKNLISLSNEVVNIDTIKDAIANPEKYWTKEMGGGYWLKDEDSLENGYDIMAKTKEKFLKNLEDAKNELESSGVSKENKFLQLLNKDNNWVTFFVKSIIQDTAKKGYEKVVFPTGSTAYKIESGGRTIEDFIKNKEDRLKQIKESYHAVNINGSSVYGTQSKIDAENYAKDKGYEVVSGKDLKANQNEINRLEKEISDAKEGASGLAATAKFYETTVANVLKKQGYNPKVVTDEYGSTWNEIDIKVEDLNTIFFNVTPTKGEGEVNEPVTAGAIKQLEDEGMITKAGTALNTFTINEYTAENVNKIQDLLESKSIEYKRTGDNIKIYGLPVYKYSHEFVTLDTEEDEINTIQDLKKELGITSKPLSFSQFNDIAKSLKAYNQQNETNYLLVADQQQDGSITVKTIVQDQTLNRSTLDVTQELMDRLQGLFPEIKVQYINQNELSKFSDGRFSNTDISVNTFVKDGIVYLVKDRFTGDMVVEEFLHPFVSAIMFDNPKLADSLYAEMLDRYPDIANMVEKTYTEKRGWSEEDRKNEIITKGLQRAFSERIQDSFKAKDKVAKGLIEKVLDFITNIIRKLTGRKKLYTGELSSKMSVDDIINMLDSNVQVKLGLIDAKAYPNLSQEKIDILNYILKNATAEQKEVVEALFDNGIVHNEVDHTYEKVIFDENGEVEEIINYTSMTTAIKGEFTDTAYALNRDIGTEFDFIMNSVIMGEDFDVIKPQLKVVSEAAAANFYNMIMGVVIGIKSSGAIIVPQVVVGADADGIAGKMDMLIIDPSGKMRIIDLKTSATNDVKNDPKKYNKKYEITNEDSMLYGEKLSNRDLHALQQHGYKRMIELDGRLTEYEVESVKTLHYRFKIEDGMATEVKPDDEVDHTDGHYDELLNKIIPSQPLDRTNGLTSNLSTEAAKPENKETIKEIRDLVKDASNMLQKRKEFYEKINETSKGKFIVTKEYLSALDDIIASLNEAILVGKPASAYYQLVKYINQDVKDKARTLGKMTDKSEGLQFMLEAEKDLNTYRELLLPPKLYLNNKTVTKLAQESHNVIQQTLDLINTEIHNFTVDFIANNTNRDLTREEIEGIIKEAEDISMHEYQFGDLSTSSDLLLSVMDKVYKRKRQEIIDFVQKLEIEIKTAGNKLAALSPDKKTMYDFMIGMDDKGNLTGYSVDKIGKKYWSMKRELRQKLTDPETGLRYKYREIRNPKDASQVDIDFNLNLKKLKDEETEFNKKEYLNDKGELVDGPYHKYSDEFKKARSKVMRLKIHKNAEGDPVSFEWIAKNKESKEFKEFQKKYYSGEVFYLSAKKEYDKSSKTYIFKGRTEENSDRFVKSEHVEIREIAENNEDMRDEKYVKIMTDTSELGLARKEYYETWKRLYGELLEKLPDGVKMRTKLPVIQSGMIAQAKKMGGGANYYKGILKGVANKINPFPKSTFHHSTLLDENGNVVSNIPVFYTGDLKSEYAIEKTRERISELNQRWAKKTPDADGKVLSYQEYRTQLDKLTKSLKIEQGKTSANELSTEMTNNLVQFAEMAENFQVMSEFESTVISVLRTLKNRKVLKRDPDGNFITNTLDKATAKFRGDDSLAEQRLRKWMDMVLYNSKNPYRSRMGNLVKKVKLLMSIKGVGLNPFGQLNNLKMGNINNMVEAAGGTIFNKSDYKKAIKGYTVDYLPAFLSAKKDYILSKKSDKNGEYYTLPRSLTKYDALVNKYRMMRAMQSKDGIEGYEGKTMDLLFMMQHGAEFSIQSKSGIAVLHNRTFTNKVTGEKVSIYDAHSFDQKTGELILDSSLYEETDQDRYDMTNLIYETNKRLHGNYAWEDRMVIQQGLIGEMIAQFHKWVYPFVRRFWGKTYHDENLGETEGIFISFWKLNKAVYDMTKLDGSFWKGITNKKTFTEAWATMSDYQKSNITRLLGYFAFYLLSMLMKWIWSAIADELGDDEDTNPTTMKLVNFMAYLDDRTMSEISVAIDPTQIGQFIKNPVAIVGFIGDVWDALSESAKFILPPYGQEDEVFQRGVNKGEYKWQKEWGDVLPFFSAINKWDSFEELKSFYIK